MKIALIDNKGIHSMKKRKRSGEKIIFIIQSNMVYFYQAKNDPFPFYTSFGLLYSFKFGLLAAF